MGLDIGLFPKFNPALKKAHNVTQVCYSLTIPAVCWAVNRRCAQATDVFTVNICCITDFFGNLGIR
jgi:hypothetical protein